MLHASLVLALGLAVPTPRAPRAADGVLASNMPARVALYVEARTIAGLLAGGLAHPLVRAALAEPLVALGLADLPVPPAEALAFADSLLGRPVLPTLARLASRGVALGVEPTGDGEPHVFLVLAGEDEELLEDVLDELLELAEARGGAAAELLDASSGGDAGVEVWRLGPQLSFARDGATLIATRELGALRRALTARAGRAPSLATSPSFTASVPASALRLHLDVTALEAGAPGTRTKLEEFVRSPGSHLALGPALTYLARAEVIDVTAALDGAAGELRLLAVARGIEEGPGAATFPAADSLRPSPPAPRPGDVARALLYRDVASVTRLRAELFPPRTLPGFAKAFSDLGLLFGGLDIAEELLPRTSPWVTLVVRHVSFDPAAAPDLPLPALCAVVRVDDARTTGPRLVSAFQTAVGLANVDAAQKGRTPFVMDLALAEDVTITRARLPAPAPGAAVDARYNLVPACALVGDAFVVGTHAELVREVALQLRRGDHSTAQPGLDDVSIAGPALAAILRANRDAFTLDAVLSEGKERGRAEAELDGIAHLLERVDLATLCTRRPASGRLEVGLVLRIAPGEVAPARAEKGR